MATAPFQLWMDLAPISTAVRSGSTVTITTASSHGLTTGAYVDIGGIAGTAGTSMNGVYQVTSLSGTTFSYTAAGTAGTPTATQLGSAYVAYDLLNPPINYASGTARQNAMVADISTLNLSSTGDGSSTQATVTILQETTPAVGPWFKLIPDNTRVRMTTKATGSAYTSADIIFRGLILGNDATLNGSGQGNIANVVIANVNWMLDKMAVFGKRTSGVTVFNEGVRRISNSAWLMFLKNPGFTVGQSITVNGITNPNSPTTFNGTYTITDTGTIDGTDGRVYYYIRYPNTGVDLDGPLWGDPSGLGGIKPVFCTPTRTNSRANDSVTLTATGSAKLFVENSATILVGGGNTGFSAGLRELIVGRHSGDAVIKVSDTVIRVKLKKPHTGSFSMATTVSVRGTPIVYPNTPNLNQNIVTITSGQTETSAAVQMVQSVNDYNAADPAVQRLVNTSGTASIIGSSTNYSDSQLDFPSCTLRSALDTVIENYGGQDAKLRRYWIDNTGTINYALIDAANTPTYATAPYVVTTDSGAGTPNTTTGKASVAPFSLSVNYDHDGAKRGVFTAAQIGATPVSQIFTYSEMVDSDGTAIFTTRKGAPTLDVVVDFPTSARYPSNVLPRAAIAYFLERHKPIVSGSFTLRGAGTQSFNANGFSAGYAQTGASTFALVNSWQPGQWVEIISASLGLSGLYRVESVDWSLEPGSYFQQITVQFGRRNPYDLAALIANSGAR